MAKVTRTPPDVIAKNVISLLRFWKLASATFTAQDLPGRSLFGSGLNRLTGPLPRTDNERSRSFISFLILFLSLAAPRCPADFTVDLPMGSSGGENYYSLGNQLLFLSEHTAVIAVNRQGRRSTRSPLLVVDVDAKRVRARAEFPMYRSSRVIGRIDDHTFALATAEGLLSCTDELTCSKVIDKSGEVSVSPSGKFVAVRDFQAGQYLLDTESWKLLATYPSWISVGQLRHYFRVIPGDKTSVLQKDNTITIQKADGTESVLSGVSTGADERGCSYISPELVAVTVLPLGLLVFDSAARELYRLPISDPFHADVVAACCGSGRFAITESSYSFWNSVVHFMDIDMSRQRDVFRVRVFEVVTGKEVGGTEWDPRPGITNVALSPKGDLIGAVRGNKVQVVSVADLR